MTSPEIELMSCWEFQSLMNLVMRGPWERGWSQCNQEPFNKSTSVFYASVVIDHEFRHNIVKVAVDPRGDSRVDPQTTLTML